MTEQTGRLTGIFDLDLSPLERGLRRARQLMERFDDDDAAADLSLNQRPFDRGLQNARRKLSDLSDEEGEVDVGANLSPLSRGLTRARGMLSRMRGERADVTVGANTAPAATGFAAVDRWRSALNSRSATVNVGTRGAPAAIGALMMFGRARSAVDGRNAIVNIGTRGAAGAIASMVAVGAAARILGAAVQMGTQQGINRFNKAALFASNVAAYGMRVAIFGLVGAFGPLVGMAGVAASAVASVGAGFGLLGLAAIPTMKALTTEGAKLTASQKALKAEAKGFYSAFERAFAPATTRVEQLATATMRYARGALGPLGRTAKLTADAVGRAGANMRKQFDDPRQLALFNEFLSRVPNMTRLFTQAAGQFGLGSFNMLVAAQPVAQRFLGYLNRITLQFSRWSSSAQGQQQMRQFFESVTPVARALGRAIASVTTGLFKLTTQPAVIGFFTKLLNAITFIGQRIQPALTPLFQGMNRAAGLFAKIPEPIRSAAATVGIFAAAVGLLAGGPLIILGSILMRVAGAFRLLSAPVRALGPLFAKIGPLFTRIGGALTRVVPFFTRLGGIFGRIVPLVARFVPWIARIALIGAVANPVGLVVTAITLLGTAFIMAYRRSEAFRNAVNRVASVVAGAVVAGLRALWNATKLVAGALGRAAVAVGRFIGRLAAQRVRQYGAVLRFLWQMAKPVIQWLGRAAVAVGKFVARLAVGAVRVFGRVLGAIWKAAQPVVNWIGRAAATVGRFIAKLAVGAVRVFGRVIGAIWRAAKPVVTWLGKAAVAAGRFLLKLDGLAGVRAFVAVVKAIWRAAKPVVQWLGKAAVAVGKFIARLAVKGLRLFVNGLRAIWNGARTLIRWIGNAANAVGRFVNRGRESAASLRGVWNRFWNGLKALWNRSLTAIGNRLESWRDAFRSLVERIAGWVRGRWDAFWGGLRGLWNRALTAIGNRTESWRDAFRSLIDRIAKWIRQRWDSFWSGLRGLWDRSWTAIGNRTESWRDAFRSLVDRIAKWIRDRWNSFWGGLRGLWDRSLTAIGNRTESWRDALRNLFDNIAKWARGRWDSFWSGMRGLWDRAFSAIGDRARSWGQAIKDIFLKVKGWMTSPMEKARDILKGIWNSILGGIGKVLGAVGLKEAAGKINGAKWATGGTTADGGGQAFARGGTTTGFRQFANGGMGTSSRQPRVHMWNEQMGHEAYITERGNPRQQMKYLDTAASWHGAQVIPYEKGGFASRGYDPPQRRPHRRDPGTPSLVDPYKHRGKIGGEGFGPTTYNWSPLMQGYVNQVRSKFPVSVNTYTNHPGGERNSADAWAPGGRGSAINRGTGDSVASWLVDNVGELNWLIWAGRILTGGGWKPYNGFGGPHHDHVHWTAGKPGGASAKGGGFSVPNPMQILFDKTWNNTVGRTMDSFRNRMEGGHVLRQGTAGAATIVTQGIHKWIDDKIPDTIGGGGGGGSTKQMREWARSGLSYGGVYPPSDANVSKVVTLMGKESSGDPNAKNPSGASGLMQMKPATFNQYKKAPGDQIMNPMHNVGASTRYQQGRYGKLVTFSPYARGGVIPGMGPKYLMAHGGERVLSADLNQGFEALAASIDTWNSRGATAPSVDVGDNHRDLQKLIDRVDYLTERVDHQTRTAPRATGAAVKHASDYNLEHDRDTRERADKGSQRTQRKRSMSGRQI